LPLYKHGPRDKKVWTELREGFTYLKQTPSIAKVIFMLAGMSLLVIPYVTLLPVYAKVIFKGNASTFGYIDSFIGLGAISGALCLASLGATVDRKKILWVNTLVFGLGLILFSHTTSFPLAMVFAMLSGFGMMAQTTISNTIIQTSVAPAMRGRVISYFAMAYFGMQPLGSLLVGGISQVIGAPNTMLIEGLCALLIVAIFWSFLSKKEAHVDHAAASLEVSPLTGPSVIKAAPVIAASLPPEKSAILAGKAIDGSALANKISTTQTN
jgi:MFS family permease